jgi:hypothetical protein
MMDPKDISDPVLQDVTDRETMQSPEDAVWSTILGQIRAQYPALMSLKQALPLNKLSIDGGFVFKAYPDPQADPNNEDFRYYHVEPLLDQAADLLDRVLRDRAAWDELMIKSYYFAWDIEQFQKFDLIRQNEVKAGIHTVDYKESFGRNAEDVLGHKTFDEINNTIKALLQSYYGTDAVKQKQIDDAVNAAYATPWPNYKSEVPADISVYQVDGKAKATIFSETASADTKRRVDSDEASLKELERQSFLSRESSGARSVGSTARLQWEFANSDFKLQRDKIARDFVQYKAYLASIPGNPLHYAEQTSALSNRFNEDFTHAVARIVAVQRGLKSIYGYDVALPTKGAGSYDIDDCVLWVRTAINWLVRFSRVDQNYVLAVSVKQHLKGDWATQAAAGSWNFEISEDLFPDQRHVRLRGLGVCIASDGGDQDLSSTWVATIRAPATSWCVQREGTRAELDQSGVPPCRLGRVSSRYAPRDIDVTGVSALHNTSPFGIWNVTAGKTSSTGLPLSSIKDIVVDLHLAVHAPKSVAV